MISFWLTVNRNPEKHSFACQGGCYHYFWITSHIDVWCRGVCCYVPLPCQTMILSIIMTHALFTFNTEYDRLIDCTLFNILFENISVKKVRHHCQWRAAKVRFMLGAYSLLTGKHLYRAAPAMTRGLCFHSSIRRTTPFHHLLRQGRDTEKWTCSNPEFV